VRVNLHWPCPRWSDTRFDATEHIGHQTDVVIVTESVWNKGWFQFPDVKYIVIIVQQQSTKMMENILGVMDRGDYDYDILLWNEAHLVLNPILHCTPSTGMIAMHLVMETDPKELFVCGYDFFTQTFRGWKPHDPVAEREYFRDVILPNPKVSANSITEASAMSNIGERRTKSSVQWRAEKKEAKGIKWI